ncbi:hypothetical protein [Gallaecimonas xiamenensis]|uniref:Uncharacterized protein n=1 Tax=Gallaecimonas xiamenensis 3-C-1 TaxID=745411 RepID=K2JIZ2_9GAMM|nr:hypothetical protein [Gallaecimonas xiamenensis]EKE75193.1 hypothetical protein B3C1_07951 [Gallaecimonas xiamenensis 3-C-1]
MSEEVEQGKGINEWLKDYWLALTVVVVAVLAVTAIIYFYRQAFPGPIDAQHDAFGTFGDYVGGLLNPILSFLTIVLLIWSLHMQRQELVETRKELKQAAQAQSEMAALARKSQRLEEIERIIKQCAAEIEKCASPCDTYKKCMEVVVDANVRLVTLCDWAFEYYRHGGAERYCAEVIFSGLELCQKVWRIQTITDGSDYRRQMVLGVHVRGLDVEVFQILKGIRDRWVESSSNLGLDADHSPGLLNNSARQSIVAVLSSMNTYALDKIQTIKPTQK